MQIHQDHVGGQGQRLAHGGLPVDRRTDHLDPGEQREQQQEAVPYHPLVVGHQHPDRPAVPGGSHQDHLSFVSGKSRPVSIVTTSILPARRRDSRPLLGQTAGTGN